MAWTNNDFATFFAEVRNVKEITDAIPLHKLVTEENTYVVEVQCWSENQIHYFEMSVTHNEMLEWSLNRRGTTLGEGLGILDTPDRGIRNLRYEEEYWFGSPTDSPPPSIEPIVGPLEEKESTIVDWFKAKWAKITYRKPYF